MANLNEELKQYALMTANKIKRKFPEDNQVTNLAYVRVKSMDDSICPRCWVIDETMYQIDIDVIANECNVYKCARCGFRAALPKT